MELSPSTPHAKKICTLLQLSPKSMKSMCDGFQNLLGVVMLTYHKCYSNTWACPPPAPGGARRSWHTTRGGHTVGARTSTLKYWGWHYYHFNHHPHPSIFKCCIFKNQPSCPCDTSNHRGLYQFSMHCAHRCQSISGKILKRMYFLAQKLTEFEHF